MKKTYSIYCLTNKVNGKKYVGFSYRPEKRMESHRKSKYPIGKAIRKYGWQNFTKRILQKGLTLAQAKSRERFYVKKYNCKAPNGYNLCEGGEGVFNPSAETRAKQSKAQKGKKHSAEHRTKISKANKGKKRSAEHRTKISKANKGKNNPMFGKKHSAATKAKQSKALIGKNHPMFGKNHSAETKAKMSKNNAMKRPEVVLKQLARTAKRKGITVEEYAQWKLELHKHRLHNGTRKIASHIERNKIAIRDMKKVLRHLQNKRHSTKYNIDISRPKAEKVLVK